MKYKLENGDERTKSFVNFLAESIELRQFEEHHSLRILETILSSLSNKSEIAEDKTEIGVEKNLKNIILKK